MNILQLLRHNSQIVKHHICTSYQEYFINTALYYHIYKLKYEQKCTI
jgi:hypothetical protein